MKNEYAFKKVFNFPEGPEKEGRLQALVDINNGVSQLNRAKYIKDISDIKNHNNPEFLYWDSYQDTYKSCKDGDSWMWMPKGGRK